MPAPVVNNSSEALVFVVNGKSWLFPPKNSQQYWTVVDRPGGIGEKPYVVESSDNPREGSIRGPIVSVPDHVANALKTASLYLSNGSDQLVIGSQANDVAREEAERFNVLRDKAAAELAAAQAELAKVKAELERAARSSK